MLPRILKALGFRFWSGEVWHAKPCIIVDGSGKIVWSGSAVIEYQPGEKVYEGGKGKVLDGETGALVLNFTLRYLNRRDKFAIPAVYRRVLRGTSGLTINLDSEEYGRVNLYMNTHAASYELDMVRRKAGLIKFPAYEEVDP